MASQYSFLVKIAVITFLVTVLWAASVAFTYWDTRRQRLSGRIALAWVILVTLLPFLGFTAYILFRSLSISISSKFNKQEPPTRRVTALKPPMPRKRPLSTISASDIDIQVLYPKKTIQAGAAPPVVFPRYSVAITSGADGVKEFLLEKLPARIGRGSEAVIRLDGDLGVSRKHAEIYEQGGTLRIRDLQSTHGTQVNGLRIADRALEPGDRIQVGSTILLVKRIKE